MTVETCRGCGRLIALSPVEPGENGVQQCSDEYSTRYRVCIECGAYHCDRCSGEACKSCGGLLVTDDGLAEEKDFLENEITPEIEAFFFEIRNFDPSAVLEIAEPGTLAVLEQLCSEHTPALQAELAENGRDLSLEKCRRLVAEQFSRAYLASRRQSSLHLERQGDCSFNDVAHWFGLELFVRNVNAETAADRYPGLSDFIKSCCPGFLLGLTVCSYLTLERAGIEPESVTEPLERHLAVITDFGFTLGVAEAQARATQMIITGKSDVVPTVLLHHFVNITGVLPRTPGTADTWKFLYDLLNILSCHPENSVRLAARAACLRLERIFGEQREVGSYKQAMLFVSAGLLVDAFGCFKESAENGDTDSMYCLAVFYELGIACKKSRRRQRKLIKKAARAGHKGALGECLIEGLGMRKDIQRGMALLTECAEAGETFAQGSLAGYYLTGEGGLRDKEKALCWLNRAAENGNSLAQWALSNMDQNPLLNPADGVC